VKVKNISVAAALSLLGLATANANELSFIAPLVKESLLLGVSEGKHNIIVGERGHILVNQTTGDAFAENFRQVLSPANVTLTDVFSLNNFAWAVGHDATIIKSSDAGLTWTLVQSDPDLDRPLLSVYFFDEKEGIAAGAYGLFYRSINGGDSWVQERHPGMLSPDDNDYLDSIKDDEAFYLEELSFISPHLNKVSASENTLYVAGEAGLLATSSDKGKSWERIDIGYQGSFFDVGILPNEISLAVGLRGHMFVLATDEQLPIETCVTTSLNSVITSENKVFVAGNNGVILSIDIQKLNEDSASAYATYDSANIANCKRHPSVSLVNTDFSDAILGGIISNDRLLLVTAGGLKTVVIEE